MIYQRSKNERRTHEGGLRQELERELEREREREREQERELEQEQEREREREQERELEREQEREREREQERELEQEQEREQERELEREQELEREPLNTQITCTTHKYNTGFYILLLWNYLIGGFMKTWQSVDRSKWHDQSMVPESEPDKAQWIDEATGLDCLIVRGPVGALCGYVGVPESSPHFEVDYDNVKVNTDDEWPLAHGGLTFSDRCRPQENPAKGICHTGDVANKTVWWLGFDCAHCDDLCPAYDCYRGDERTYKDFEYVKQEVTYLAKQLAA